MGMPYGVLIKLGMQKQEMENGEMRKWRNELEMVVKVTATQVPT